MTDNTDWAAVARAYLFGPPDDLTRMALADLFESAGDEESAAKVRGRGVHVWAVDDRSTEHAYYNGHEPDTAAHTFRRDFPTLAEAAAFSVGFLSEDRPGAACFFGLEETLSYLRGEWLYLGNEGGGWFDDDHGEEGWDHDDEDDGTADPDDFDPYDEGDPHVIELPPADTSEDV